MAAPGTPIKGRPPTRASGLVLAAAAHALVVGFVGAGVAALLVRRWLAGAPAVTVVELWEPGLVLFAPGDEISSPFGGPALTVTEAMVRALAAGQVGLFGGLGLLGWIAGAGLLARRPAGRIVALVLFTALLLLGLANLAALGVAAAVFGGAPRDVLPMIAAVGLGFVVWPGVSLLSVRRGAPHRPAAAGASEHGWRVALAVHFGLLAGIFLLTALPGRDAGLLIGPWLLTGRAALIVGLALAAAHAAVGLLVARRHPTARRSAALLSALAAASLGASALLASAGAVEQAGGLPGQHRGLRWILALAALLSAGLALRLARTRVRRP